MHTNRRDTILIVDDTAANIDILLELLSTKYNISVATSGLQALQTIQHCKPDLILLDVMMPDMDGFEVCKHIKNDKTTRNIPVLFLTALADNVNEVKGLECGAVDYINKPFEPVILNARINTHLSLQNANRQLNKFNTQLAQMVKEKSQQLAQAHQRLKILDSTKNDFLSAISHELRTPANGVLGVAQLALFGMGNTEERKELQEVFDSSSDRLLSTINNAMLLAQLQTSNALIQTSPTTINTIIDDAVRLSQVKATQKQITITAQTPPPIQIKCVEQLTQQALTTIVQTMIQLSDTHEQINIAYETNGNILKLIIQSHGKTLPKDTIDTLFNTFSNERASSYVEQMGLALPLAAKIVSAMEGTINLQNINSRGIKAEISFPVAV